MDSVIKLIQALPLSVPIIYLCIALALIIFLICWILDCNINKSRYYYKTIVKTLIMIIALVSASIYLFTVHQSPNSTDDTDISTRIENISQNLSEASTELSSIQKELEERIEFVENLKIEAEVAGDMISLTDEQVSAIRTKLKQELSASSRQSLIQGILISAFFFILGYVVNWLKTKSKEKFANDSANLLSQYSDEEISAALNLLDSLKNKNKSQNKKD